VTFGALFLDEPVTIWLALGGLLVVGGIAAAQGLSFPRSLTRTARSGHEHADGNEIAETAETRVLVHPLGERRAS
jgi:hypothetical protein